MLSLNYVSASLAFFLILCQPTRRKRTSRYQGEKQVTSIGNVKEGTEAGLEPQSPRFSCLGCVTLDMSPPLSESRFPHL